MKFKKLIGIVILLLLLITQVFAFFDKKLYVFDYFSSSNSPTGSESYIIDVASCVVETCIINSSVSSDTQYIIYTQNSGVKYLWRSEP